MKSLKFEIAVNAQFSITKKKNIASSKEILLPVSRIAEGMLYGWLEWLLQGGAAESPSVLLETPYRRK